MIVRVERIIRLFVVPFLSVTAMFGVGYSFWTFNLDGFVLNADDILDGKLAVEGVATSPLTLDIVDPAAEHGYDGYRLVFDQGGLGSRFDEEVGVRLSTSSVFCNLKTIRELTEDDLSSMTTTISLTAIAGTESVSCPCLERIQFKTRDAGTYLKLTSKLIDLAGDAWLGNPVISEDGSSYTYSFAIPIELEWRNGMKPIEDASWQAFIGSINTCSAKHVLTIDLDNGIL